MMTARSALSTAFSFDLVCSVAVSCSALLLAGCSLSLDERHERPEVIDGDVADVATDSADDPETGDTNDADTSDADTSDPDSGDADSGDPDAPDADIAVCGDGVIGGDEQCEPGPDGPDEICSGTCRWVLPSICLPCEDDDDCGGAEDRCLESGGVQFCSTACGPDTRSCPNSTTCIDYQDAGQFCIAPAVTLCGVSCIDSDRDDAGIGPLCAGGWDCDDSNTAINPSASEVCDGVDNDCDGEVDEDADTAVCLGPAQCVAGTCQSELEGWTYINAGSFDLGSDDGNEDPRHPVVISYDFLIMTTEMTSEGFAAIFAGFAAPSHHDVSDCATCPVENVSFASALEAANALSRADGLNPCYTLGSCTEGTTAESGGLACLSIALATDLTCDGYRLPTEAEWEYIARAGTGGDAPFAADLADDCRDLGLSVFGWYCGNAVAMAAESGTIPTDLPSDAGGPGLVRTRPVVPVSLMPNDWGVLGLYGNVSEWIWDIDGVYQSTIQTDPIGPLGELGGGAIDLRIVRGCAVTDTADDCRVSRRIPTDPTTQDPTIGFRLVRTLSPIE